MLRPRAPVAVVRTMCGCPGDDGGHADGPVLSAQLNGPCGVALGVDDALVISDSANHCIRAIDVEAGSITTIAGTAGRCGHTDGTSAKLNNPKMATVLCDGRLVISDTNNHCIRLVDPRTEEITTPFGQPGERGHADGPGEHARFDHPVCVIELQDGKLAMSDLRCCRTACGSY